MKRLVLFLLILTLFPAANAWAQATGQVTGRVTSATGQPIVGAAVSVAGRGDITGANGAFTITAVPTGTQTLRASNIGFAERTQSVTVVAGQTVTVNVQLQAQVVQLEELVAVGYGTARRQDVTGAVSSVSAAEVRTIPTPSVAEALKGRVPGMDIRTTNYLPGQQPQIRIRGARSLQASNNPLIVVDGQAIEGSIGDISPSTIASIEVLKDASATAVYGSRGANGVILISTTRGQAGGMRINYDTRYGLQEIHNMVDVFNAEEFADFKRWAARRVNKYPCPGTTICDAGDAAIMQADELQYYRAGLDTNWFDVISRTGRIMDHQLGISGGTTGTRFAISGNFLDENGVTLGTNYLRRNATASIDHTEGRFRTGLSANITSALQNLGRGNGLWGEAAQLVPFAPVRDESGAIIVQPTTDAQRWNPLADIQNWKNDNLRTRTFGNAFIGYEVLDGLSLQTTFGADLINVRDGEFRGACTQPFRCTNNDAFVNRSETFNWVSTTQANAERGFGSAHRVNATALYEVQQNRGSNSQVRVQNLPYEHQLYYNIGSAGQVTNVGSNFSEWLLQSFMGRANYILHDRYYLTLTGRQDCSSRLAEGNKCSFFPSGAVKWRLSDEGFMQNQGFFSDLALRASYGLTGNTSIAPYQTQGGLARTVYSFNNVGAFGYRPNTLANPGLGWEKTAQYDVGVEFGVLQHRISGEVDFYVQNTSDLLMNQQLPFTSGFGSTLRNIGETRNTGVELALSTVNLEGWNGITWTSDLNWSANRNRIVSLYGGFEDDVGSGWFIGQPVNVLYNYDKIGIWQLGEEAEATQFNRRPGDIKVRDINGDGRITAQDDRILIGNHTNFPKWTGSLNNRVQFRDFDLSAMAYARWGYTIQSGSWPGQMSGRYNQPKLDYWTPENPTNAFPSPNRDSEGAIDASTAQYFDGSHWRVRNVTLGYNVPPALTGRIGNNSTMRVYVQAQDPFVFSNFPGFDPEGAEGNSTPSFRTLLVGFNVGF